MGLSMTAILTDTVTYLITGYFYGVLIFGIFVVHPGVTNFSTHKIFHTLCSAVYTCSNLDRQCFVMALFHYLGPIVDTEEFSSKPKFAHVPSSKFTLHHLQLRYGSYFWKPLSAFHENFHPKKPTIQYPHIMDIGTKSCKVEQR